MSYASFLIQQVEDNVKKWKEEDEAREKYITKLQDRISALERNALLDENVTKVDRK